MGREIHCLISDVGAAEQDMQNTSSVRSNHLPRDPVLNGLAESREDDVMPLILLDSGIM